MKLERIIPVLLLMIVLSACSKPGAAPVFNHGNNTQTQGFQTVDTTGKLTEEEVKSIALTHAGFTADQVSRLRVEFEYDDGIPEYNVEFREGHLEYDYDIHAVTGQILSFEKDDS